MVKRIKKLKEIDVILPMKNKSLIEEIDFLQTQTKLMINDFRTIFIKF